jgi:hypothetical protein
MDGLRFPNRQWQFLADIRGQHHIDWRLKLNARLLTMGYTLSHFNVMAM